MMTEHEHEVARIRARCDDYITEARLSVEHARATYATEIAKRLRPYLAEVLDCNNDNGLTEEQKLFRTRLREIKVALEGLGVRV